MIEGVGRVVVYGANEHPPRPSSEQLDEFAKELITSIDQFSPIGDRQLGAAAYTDAVQREHYNLLLRRIEQRSKRLDQVLGQDSNALFRSALNDCFHRVTPTKEEVPQTRYVAEVRDSLRAFEQPESPRITEGSISFIVAGGFLKSILATLNSSEEQAKSFYKRALAAKYSRLELNPDSNSQRLREAREADDKLVHSILASAFKACRNGCSQLLPLLERSATAAHRAVIIEKMEPGKEHPLPYVEADPAKLPNNAAQLKSTYQTDLPPGVETESQRLRCEVRKRAFMDEIYPRVVQTTCAGGTLVVRAIQKLDPKWAYAVAGVYLAADPLCAAYWAQQRAARIYDFHAFRGADQATLDDPDTHVGLTRNQLINDYGPRWVKVFEHWAAMPGATPLETAFQVSRNARTEIRRALLIDQEGNAPVLPSPSHFRKDDGLTPNRQMESLWDLAKSTSAAQLKIIYEKEDGILDRHFDAVEGLEIINRVEDHDGARCLSFVRTEVLNNDFVAYDRFLREHPRLTNAAELRSLVNVAFSEDMRKKSSVG